MSRDCRCVARGKKQDHGGDIVRLYNSADRELRGERSFRFFEADAALFGPGGAAFRIAVRFRKGGVDDVDGDTVGGHFIAELLGKIRCRSVAQTARECIDADIAGRGAADDDDPPAIGCPQMRQCRPAAPHRGKSLTHDPFHGLLVRERFKSSADIGGGIIDQNVEAAERVSCCGDGLRASFCGEQVGCDGVRLYAGGFNFRFCFRQRLGVAAANRYIGAFAGKGERNRAPNAPIAARNKDGLTRKVQIDCSYSLMRKV